jgi:hypothetical protein
LTARARHFSVTRADQISCPLQGRVPRIAFQQDELLVSPCADAGGQGAIIVPEIRVRAVDHCAGSLEGLYVSGFVVGQGAIDAVVDAPGVKIGLKLRVNTLRMALVKPYVQLFHLLRRERVYCAFNFPYCV